MRADSAGKYRGRDGVHFMAHAVAWRPDCRPARGRERSGAASGKCDEASARRWPGACEGRPRMPSRVREGAGARARHAAYWDHLCRRRDLRVVLNLYNADDDLAFLCPRLAVLRIGGGKGLFWKTSATCARTSCGCSTRT